MLGDPNLTKIGGLVDLDDRTRGELVNQDRRARPTHRPGDSTATLRKGSPMKLSRRSGRCQRNRAISRMSLCVYLMQPLNRSALLSDIGMTPALKHAPPANSARFRITRTWNAALIFCAALVVFASSLHALYFEDEYAYINQSYYADLFFTRQFNDPLWLDHAGDRSPAAAQVFDRAGLSLGEFADAESPAMRGSGTTTIARSAGRRRWWPHAYRSSRWARWVACHFRCRCDRERCAGGNDRRAIAHVQSALFASRPSGDGRRAVRGVHAVGAGGLALAMWSRIWSGGSACRRSWFFPWSRVCSRACRCFASSTVSSGWRSSRAGSAGHLAVARSFDRPQVCSQPASIVTIAVALAARRVAFNPYLTARPAGSLSRASTRYCVSKNVWERFLTQVDFASRSRNARRKTRFPNDALFDVPRKTKRDPRAGLRPVRAVRARGLPIRECGMTSRRIGDGCSGCPFVMLGLYQTVRLGLRPASGQASRRLRWPWSSGPSGLGGRHALSADGLGPLSASDSKRQRPAGRGGMSCTLGSTRRDARVSPAQIGEGLTRAESFAQARCPGSSSSCLGAMRFSGIRATGIRRAG